MLWEEFDKEEYKRLFRKEYLAEGRAEGQQTLILKKIANKLKKGKVLKQIAEEMDMEMEQIQPLIDLIQAHPDMSCEELCALETSTAI